MSRLVTAATAVNANVNRPAPLDLDQMAEAAEVGTVPAALNGTCIATEYGDNLLHKTVLTLTACPISLADDAGQAQYGGVLIYTFPRGLIASIAACVEGNLTLGVTGTFIDAFTGVNALGTVAASTGASLVSTEATWLQSTANATASSKVAAISSVSIATQLTESGGRVHDGRATASPVYLNFAIADDDSHTAGTGTFTGTVTIMWSKVR